MPMRYYILRKKLQELKLDLSNEASLDSSGHNLNFQDINQRIEFLKNLLSTEITSSPEKPHHLQHIGNELSELETIFRYWQDNKTITAHLETDSTCSCTESCLNDDGEAATEVGSCGFEEKENAVEEKNEEEVRVEEMSEVKKELEKGSFGVAGWQSCGSLGVGVVIGMASMVFVMINLCDCFSSRTSRMCYSPT